MTGILQHRRSNTAGILAATPAPGEIFLNTDTWKAIVGDGATAGGLQTDRAILTTKTSSYPLVATDSGQHFDNVGAVGAVTFTLPAAVRGLNFWFTVFAAQNLIVLCGAGDQVAVGNLNSAAAGNIQSNVPFSSIFVMALDATQWVVKSQTGSWTVT